MSNFHKLVEKQRRKLALKFHPDMGGDEDKMKEINNAADFLLNLKVIQPRPQVVFDMTEIFSSMFTNVTFASNTTTWTRRS